MCTPLHNLTPCPLTIHDPRCVAVTFALLLLAFQPLAPSPVMIPGA